MADKKISQLTAAAALTGSEPIPTVQGGVTVQTTAQDIADLAAGGSSFLPNGVKIITESRELQSDDAGYFLVLMASSPDTPVILTIPEVCPIPVGASFAVVNQVDASGSNNGVSNITTEAGLLKMGKSETLVFTVTSPGICAPLSTIEFPDGGEYKTALRYLMDNAGVLFPNGIEVVTATRDFQDSDIGKFLFLTDGVGLTMPTSAPFFPNNKLIGIFAGSTHYPCDNFYEVVPGKKVYLYGACYAVQTGNESLTLITGSDFDNLQQTVGSVNGTPVFVNESDTVGYTATRYLMDNVGKNGTATLVAGTVTVADARVRTGAKIFVSVDTPGGTQGFLSTPVASIVDETSFVINSSSATETSTVNYWFVNP